MAFDRKQYGMTSGIPFIKIADRVEVPVDRRILNDRQLRVHLCRLIGAELHFLLLRD